MKRARLILALAALALLLTGWTYAQKGRGQQVAWEYEIIHTSENTRWAALQAELNNLGAQGWELVEVDHMNHRYYLKRQK